MKKLYKILATTLALALMVASPLTTVTVQAAGGGFTSGTHDDTDNGEMPDDYWSSRGYGDPSDDSGSTDSGNSGSTETSSNPTPSNPVPKVEDSGSNNGGSDNGGSNNGGSDYSEPAQSTDNSSSGNSGSTDSGSVSTDSNVQDNTNQGTVSENPNDVTTSVEGGQSFRSVMDKEHTQYDVFHKGSGVASFNVTDKDGNKVEFETVMLEQDKDGLWYLNITFAEDVDVEGLILNLLKGDLAYLADELGIAGIQINGKVVMPTKTKAGNAGTESNGKVVEEEKSDKNVKDEPDNAGAESNNKVVEEEKNTDKEVKDEPVVTEDPAGYRVCWCGYTVAIQTAGGLSADEKADWRAHATSHLANGESTSYTDVANKSRTK